MTPDLVFRDHGAAMRRSAVSAEMSVYVIRAFVCLVAVLGEAI